jgi:hypothetical protein
MGRDRNLATGSKWRIRLEEQGTAAPLGATDAHPTLVTIA